MAITDNKSYAVGRGRRTFHKLFLKWARILCEFLGSRDGILQSFSKQGHQKFLGRRFWPFCFFGSQNHDLPEFFHMSLALGLEGSW